MQFIYIFRIIITLYIPEPLINLSVIYLPGNDHPVVESDNRQEQPLSCLCWLKKKERASARTTLVTTPRE